MKWNIGAGSFLPAGWGGEKKGGQLIHSYKRKEKRPLRLPSHELKHSGKKRRKRGKKRSFSSLGEKGRRKGGKRG